MRSPNRDVNLSDAAALKACMYRPTPTWRDRAGPLVAVVLIHLGIGYALLHLSGADVELARQADLRPQLANAGRENVFHFVDLASADVLIEHVEHRLRNLF